MLELKQACPVCETDPAKVRVSGPHIHVTCFRCGGFALARSVFDDLPEWFQRDSSRPSRMSYTIRRMQRQDKPIATHPNAIETFWETPLPTPNEQANELILWIGDNQVDRRKTCGTTRGGSRCLDRRTASTKARQCEWLALAD
jgi:hypothetical protein